MATFSVNEFEEMRRYFATGVTNNYSFRKQQLRQLKKALRQYEPAITEALYKDLHKSPEEAYATEIGFIYAEISHTLSHLKSWMETEKVALRLFFFLHRVR